MGYLVIDKVSTVKNYDSKVLDQLKMKAFKKLKLQEKRKRLTNLVIKENPLTFTITWDHVKVK